jgi:hypothetical protein
MPNPHNAKFPSGKRDEDGMTAAMRLANPNVKSKPQANATKTA